MLADRLTKMLSRQQHEGFVQMIRLEDIKAQLNLKHQMEDLKNNIKITRRNRSEEVKNMLQMKY